MNKLNKSKTHMSLKRFLITLAIGMFITPTLVHAGLYRWVDENGVVHFGDRIPAKYSKIKREKYSSQGTVIDTLPAEKTKEQLVAEELQRQFTLEQQRLAKLKEHRDNLLLNSYFTVADIERTRDQKIAQISNQIELLDLNLENLNDTNSSLLERIELIENGSADDKQSTLTRFQNQLAKNESDQKDVLAKRDALEAESYKVTAFYAKEAADYTTLKLQREAEEKARLN